MKRAVFLSAFLCSGWGVFAQNLVPNPGFESNAALPTTVGQWALCSDWNNAGSSSASPDYFHHAGSMGGDLPETPVGTVSAYSGEAVMGFTATGEKGSNFREYISIQLSQPLVPGNCYLVSFRVTNGSVSTLSNAGLGSSHMGIHLSSSPLSQNLNEPLEVVPQAEMNALLYSDVWRFLGFSITASEAYEYLTIGVFGNDNDKTIDEINGNNPTIAYYFVDEFSVTEVDPVPTEYQAGTEERPIESDETPEITEELHVRKPVQAVNIDEDYLPDFFIPNAFSPDNDGINDFFAPYSVQNLNYTLCIYNRWGELVYKASESEHGWDGSVQGRQSPNDLYLWQLVYEQSRDDGSGEEKYMEGTVQVIR